MKFLQILTVCVFLVSTAFAKEDHTTLFSFDRTEVTEQLAELSNVESFVNANPGMTLDQLQANHKNVIEGVNLSRAADFISGLEGPAGIPSFLWGCILGWIGILIVYLITEDSEETKKALYGCIAQALSACLIYAVFWMLIFTGAMGSFWWY